MSAGPFALVSAGLLLALGAVVYLAAGPPVRRIRALSEAVRASAARHYVGDVPVQGRDEIAELARAKGRDPQAITYTMMIGALPGMEEPALEMLPGKDVLAAYAESGCRPGGRVDPHAGPRRDARAPRPRGRRPLKRRPAGLKRPGLRS